MQVPQEILNDWKINLDPGDKKKLAEYADVSNPTITDAFEGSASEGLIKRINQFFDEKKERIAESFKK